MTAQRVVIIGAGQAGVQAAFSLRDEGFGGPITILSAEAGAPYQRPPLSKGYLLGEVAPTALALKSTDLYREYGVDLLPGMEAESIDRKRKRVVAAGGKTHGFDHLILATGARQRLLEAPGADLQGILSLRTADDARRLAEGLAATRRLVIVGAGFIGLEIAAVARAKGIDVTVIELGERPLERALSVDMAQYLRSWHEASGARFLFGRQVASFRGDGQVREVELSDGAVVPADLVLLAVGAIPNAELAERAGLKVRDGVRVDSQLRTSDKAIFAIGDCAAHPNRFCGGAIIRLESVQNAVDQARTVASAIADHPKDYDAVPWFWSDQGDRKLQIAGVGRGHDRTVLRGDPASGRFSVLCFRGDELVAVESMNNGPDHIVGRRLLATRSPITPAQAADLGQPLKAYMAIAGV